MKSFVAACGIFGLVIGALIWNAVFTLRCTDTMTDAARQLPDNTHGDPAQYETAMQNIHLIWKEKRDIIAISVPRRITDPIDRALRTAEAGWVTGNDTVYRQSVSDLFDALKILRETEGFSLGAIV